MLYGHGGLNNARIEGSVVADFYDDALEGIMILRFYGYRYEAADFASDSDNFVRDGNDLVITIDKYPDDDITDKITIFDAYNDDPNIGTENAAFTINIEFGNEGSFTPVTEAFWHSLA